MPRLLWYVFRWGADNGYRVYDFGGAVKPDDEYGVRKLKARFGGDLVCYDRNTYVHTPFSCIWAYWGTSSFVASHNATFNPVVCIPLIEGDWCFARKKMNSETRCNPFDGWPNWLEIGSIWPGEMAGGLPRLR